MVLAIAGDLCAMGGGAVVGGHFFLAVVALMGVRAYCRWSEKIAHIYLKTIQSFIYTHNMQWKEKGA
jgi:hypothetical protein